MDEAERWRRVGEAVRARRLYLGLQQGVGGVSAATWRKIESATEWPYREATLTKVCRALLWEPETIDRLRKGRQPVESKPASATAGDLAGALDRIERRLGTIEDRLDRIADRGAR